MDGGAGCDTHAAASTSIAFPDGSSSAAGLPSLSAKPEPTAFAASSAIGDVASVRGGRRRRRRW